MPVKKRHIFTLITALFISCGAFSEYISISGSDGSYDIHAGNLAGILGGTNNQFSLSDLDILAATLNDDGIDTEGKLSFLVASTDAGLSFIGLFDGIANNNPWGSVPDQFLGLSTTTSIGTDWFATGDTGSESWWYDMGNGTQMVNSMLGWDHGQTSAGFAWGDVQQAQAGTMNLYDIDLTQFAPEPIQFITFQDDHWGVAGTADFSVLGQYAFSYQFIPAPGAIALLTIAGLSGRCRRRK
ncbi:MAG: hypothetical protein QF718_08620 [Phycisphaerales bacterium]|jgi:hypothetical protein|nr:hypothetical protein [Phycisphaerales bacterium]